MSAENKRIKQVMAEAKRDYAKKLTPKQWNKFSPQMKESLKDCRGPRPRPLMFLGWRNGKRVYVRKQSLSYFQLLEKYPPPFDFKRNFKMRHIFAKQHHLTPHRLQHKVGSYVVWGCLIAFAILFVAVYLAGFIAVSQ